MPSTSVPTGNPFDWLAQYINDGEPLEVIAMRLHALLLEGGLDLGKVAVLLAEASTIPMLTAENSELYRLASQLCSESGENPSTATNIIEFPSGKSRIN